MLKFSINNADVEPRRLEEGQVWLINDDHYLAFSACPGTGPCSSTGMRLLCISNSRFNRWKDTNDAPKPHEGEYLGMVSEIDLTITSA